MQIDLKSTPRQPGIYAFKNSNNEVIYVGKSRNLRRRLGQYQNAKRIKRHLKMRTILGEAVSLTFEVCPSALHAEILETKLIQRLRPKWNIAGAFFFLYPFIGFRSTPSQGPNGRLDFFYTTSPDSLKLSQAPIWFGCYRSRALTAQAFFSLRTLFAYIGHIEKTASKDQLPKYSHQFNIRKSAAWPQDLDVQLPLFLKGESKVALETLALVLLESPSALHKRGEVEGHLKALKRFWTREARPLHKARTAVGRPHETLSQMDRDILFLEARSKA